VNNRDASIALNLIPKLGPVRVKRLTAHFGSPAAILTARPADLRAIPGIGPEIASSIANWEQLTDFEAELRRIADFGCTVLTQADPTYPAALREIHDAPTVLYVWGEITAADNHAIGIVGARKPGHYATDCAKKLAYQLAYAGLTVISGLARGIDAAAHQGALAANGRTLAVIGSGLAKLYPAEHAQLAERIAAGHGAVISEFPMTTTADRQTFPMRNRIVAGCSFGLLVVEAGVKSGSLITAAQATEQGRSIYAIPGRITEPACFGSNKLIQAGAKLVTCAQDILDDFGMLFRETPDLHAPTILPDLSPDQLAIHTAIGDDETHIDLIASRSGLPMPKVSSSLFTLELRKLVKQLPGSRFVRIN
jgi:DNA processing protein